MRAFTVREPWGTGIVYLDKGVENRSRNIVGAYRGLVAIHTSQPRSDDREYIEAALATGLFDDALKRFPVVHGGPGSIGAFGGLPLHPGAVIGVAEIVGVHTADECLDLSIRSLAALYRTNPDEFRAFPDNGAGGVIGRARMCSPWAMSDHQHIVLANPRPLARPIPVRGFLGLWTLPADVEAAVLEQIGGAA